MKKMVAVFITGIMALSMVACGKQADTAVADQTESAAVETESPVQETESAAQEVVGLANPWHDITEEEANALVPNLFKVPEGAANVKWSRCDSGTDEVLPGDVIQADFDLDRLSYTARAQITGDDYNDISGMYYDWTVSDECTLANWGGGNMKGNVYRYLGETETVDVITWYDIEVGISYSLSTQAEDLDGFDIQAIAEQMYDETHYAGYYAPEEDSHVPMDITGCDTFTQIVDKLENDQAYANATINGEDVLLVTDYYFTGDGKPEAIDAEIYWYKDGVPAYLGYVEAAGTAYPLSVKDGFLYVGWGHGIDKYTIVAGGLVIDEEAWTLYDGDGNATYYHRSDLRDVGADENGQVKDSSEQDRIFEEFFNAEIIEFQPVVK